MLQDPQLIFWLLVPDHQCLHQLYGWCWEFSKSCHLYLFGPQVVEMFGHLLAFQFLSAVGGGCEGRFGEGAEGTWVGTCGASMGALSAPACFSK